MEASFLVRRMCLPRHAVRVPRRPSPALLPRLLSHLQAGQSALHLAAYHGNKEMVQYLVEHDFSLGDKTNVRAVRPRLTCRSLVITGPVCTSHAVHAWSLGPLAQDEMSVLELAQESEDPETIEYLNDVVEQASMDLRAASIRGDAEEVKRLIEKRGARLDTTDAVRGGPHACTCTIGAHVAWPSVRSGQPTHAVT